MARAWPMVARGQRLAPDALRHRANNTEGGMQRGIWLHLRQGGRAEQETQTTPPGWFNDAGEPGTKAMHSLAAVQSAFLVCRAGRLNRPYQADEEIRTLDPLLGKEMLYH